MATVPSSAGLLRSPLLVLGAVTAGAPAAPPALPAFAPAAFDADAFDADAFDAPALDAPVALLRGLLPAAGLRPAVPVSSLPLRLPPPFRPAPPSRRPSSPLLMRLVRNHSGPGPTRGRRAHYSPSSGRCRWACTS